MRGWLSAVIAFRAMGKRFRAHLFVCVSLAAACVRDVTPPLPAPHYEYWIAPPSAGSWILRIVAKFERAPTPRLALSEADSAIRELVMVDGGVTRPLVRVEGAWVASACRTRCTLRYSIDLDALSTSCRLFDCARRVGEAVIAPSAAWLLRPASNADALVNVAIREGDPDRFATGLRRDGHGGFVLRASELGESSYSAFGTLRRRPLHVAGATLDVAFLGSPLAMGDEATLRWIGDAAGCVAQLLGRFPVDAAVFVVPVRGVADVAFGRVMSLSGASVALLFGTETPATGAHEDWVVVHELFHLGTPSFVAEGHWLEEGLATYYEPILRARAGWIGERELWRHFVTEMRRGLRQPGEATNLEERDDIDSIYWGGALFALLADLRIRQETAGRRSLDDVIRGAFSFEGDTTHTARVADFLRVGDRATGRSILADLFARYVVGGEEVDLDALWRSLGVVQNEVGETSLRDDAPMARIRRAISLGSTL